MLNRTLEKYSEIQEPLEKLSGKITDEEMSEMNYNVNIKGESPYQVAKEFLKKEGILK